VNRTWTSSSALLLLALLAGCQTTPTTGTDSACLIWQAQSYSAVKDSKQTVDEIRAKNAVRAAYCK